MHFNARQGDTGRVYDANGDIIPGMIVSGDTESGLVEVVVTDKDGHPLRDETHCVVTTFQRFPAPLTVTRCR